MAIYFTNYLKIEIGIIELIKIDIANINILLQYKFIAQQYFDLYSLLKPLRPLKSQLKLQSKPLRPQPSRLQPQLNPVLEDGRHGVIMTHVPIVVPARSKNDVSDVHFAQLLVKEMVMVLNMNMSFRIVIIRDQMDSGELVS